MKSNQFFVLSLIFLVILFVSILFFMKNRGPNWDIRSIDTMKFSRDLSLQILHDKKFDKVIDRQMTAIVGTGATYVAIDTPYDPEFLPVLRRWVAGARRHNLHVWFRGNFSGWEQWFGYAQIDRKTHLKYTKAFILKNKDLFQNGDIFTSCPECENGAKINLGDQHEISLHRDFLIQEFLDSKNAFQTIGKDVHSNYYSMNKDAAAVIMDQKTTAALDGIVVIDHYVASPDKLASDIKNLAQATGGQIILGEFGVPIPDINGKMTDSQQKKWLEKAFANMSKIPQLKGMNYWVNEGGSTSLWNDNGEPKPAVDVITSYYTGSKK